MVWKFFKLPDLITLCKNSPYSFGSLFLCLGQAFRYNSEKGLKDSATLNLSAVTVTTQSTQRVTRGLRSHHASHCAACCFCACSCPRPLFLPCARQMAHHSLSLFSGGGVGCLGACLVDISVLSDPECCRFGLTATTRAAWLPTWHCRDLVLLSLFDS